VALVGRLTPVRITATGYDGLGIAMPHLLRLSLKVPTPEAAPYPFSVPQVRMLPQLDVNTGVTFFVGENGSGKSTLLEGIAAAAELHARGSVDLAVDDTLAPARQLGAALRLAWSPRSRQGFFLRAEDFFGYNKAQARTDARELRERTEGRVEPCGLVPSESGVHPDEREAARFIAKYDSRSHGESFMDLFAKVRPGGLYLLDEPEAPLSPKRQIALLQLLIRTSRAGAQFIIATHSPILLACPGAKIYSFDQTPVAEVAYAELEHVVVMRDFLNDPGRFIGD
jgi:predicted ATPase